MTFYVDCKNVELLFVDLVIYLAGDLALVFLALFLLKVAYEDLKRAPSERLHKTQLHTSFLGP